MSLEVRLHKLEKVSGVGEPRMAVIITRAGESLEEATAQYFAQYPQAAHATVTVFMDLGCDE